MKKIALMTWHHTENYGTAYQAYALMKTVESLGCSVDIISYKRKGMALDNNSIREIISVDILSFLRKLLIWKRYFKFQDRTFNIFYEKYFHYTSPCNYNQDFEKLNSEYDGFICGSDQIWGPKWFDARYFLDFVNNEERLIAYAPSIGVASFSCNKQIEYDIKELVCRFKHLSIREETGCRIISDLIGRKNIFNALDPVFLLCKDQWNNIEECVDFEVNESKCLIFFLVNVESNFKASIEFAKSKRLSTLILHCTQSSDTKYVNVNELTPGQLIYCIKRAGYICTDSFHVLALSIIFNKQFSIFEKKSSDTSLSQNSRIQDLLSILHIPNFDDKFSHSIEYDGVDMELNNLKTLSMTYLREALYSIPTMKNESKQEMCWKCDSCRGTHISEILSKIEKSKGLKKFLYSAMLKAPYTLECKCYRCARLTGYYFPDNRKPLFYLHLKNSLILDVNPIKIFFHYYILYFVKFLIRK